MRRERVFGIGVALTACVLALLLAGEAGLMSIAWADKPEDKPPGQGKKPGGGEELPWGVERINANKVWDPDGDLEVNPGTIRGSGIKVAVLDTGVDIDHPDLPPPKGVNTVGSEPLSELPSDYDDISGHGTMIAGIIAALDNSEGVIGIGPGNGTEGLGIDIYSVRFRKVSGVLPPDPGFVRTDPETYSFSDLYEGMQWCIDNNMQVISMSFGIWTVDQDGEREYPLHDPEFYSLIQEAYQKGIVLVGASGNDNRRLEVCSSPPDIATAYPDKCYDFPPSYPEVIGISATGKRGKRDCLASFSNYGPAIDLAAPGASIKSTRRDGGYGTGSGTSYASPHVAGAAALVLDALEVTLPAPDLPQQVWGILTGNAKPLGDPIPNEQFGYGLVDAEAAVAAVLPPAAAPRRHRVVFPAGKVSVTWGELKSRR